MAQVYRKQSIPISRPPERTRLKKARERRIFWLHRLGPLFLMGAGITVILSVLGPIVSYEFFTAPNLRADAVDTTSNIAPPQQVIERENLLPTPRPTPVVIAQELDYTDLSNWFPDHNLPFSFDTKEERVYMLSIPKLGIYDAEVKLGGKNLDNNLIQYPGTADPGDFGAPVIFGHSVLRRFYNPAISNPRRYISIFSTIMTLKDGDEILLKDDSVTYRYIVSAKTEVQPTDRFILEQQRNVRQLKLVTCVPEGTYLRRGVITANLQEVQE